MAPTTRAEQKRQTRAAIVTAAREQFDRHGYTATTAEVVARAAGISRATFYLHFRSKADVVVELMRAREPEIASAYVALDALTDPDHADVVAWLENHAAFWRTHRMEFMAMQQALAHETAVADEWFDMHRRTQEGMVHLASRCADDDEWQRAKTRVMTFMMAIDRSFYFHVLRGHDEHYGLVLDVLAEQWLALVRRA